MPPYVALQAPPPPYYVPLIHQGIADRPAQPQSEFGRWYKTLDSRAPVISAANLLLVFLLKLNRIIVPALVRWMRARRLEWIENADIDVAKEIRDHPNKRELCAGYCCRDTYGAVVTSKDVGPSSNLPPMFSMMHTWVSAFQADETDSDDSDADGSVRRKAYNERLARKKNETAQREFEQKQKSEEDIYYQLRVKQETKHREMFIGQFQYSEVLAMYVTVISLILYWAIISYFVLSNFEFTVRGGWFFSVTLLMTGITSEIDTLIMFKRRMQAGAEQLFPEMPGYYALASAAERTKLMASNLVQGVGDRVAGISKKSRKAKNRQRRGPEMSGSGTKGGSNNDEADVDESKPLVA